MLHLVIANEIKTQHIHNKSKSLPASCKTLPHNVIPSIYTSVINHSIESEVIPCDTGHRLLLGKKNGKD